jgi:hypothetical protein
MPSDLTAARLDARGIGERRAGHSDEAGVRIAAGPAFDATRAIIRGLSLAYRSRLEA